MNKNDEILLEVHDLHADGHGVGKAPCGRAVFVMGALPGEQVRVKILKVKKRHAYGKILEIIKISPHRLPESDICPIAGKCGGCQFQHLDYAAQLAFKEKLIEDALVRIGGLSSPPLLPILGMDKPYRYRNKAQFPVGPEGMGLYAPRSHRIIPAADCNINMSQEVYNVVQEALKDNPLPVYNEETHQGLLRHVVIREGQNTGEVMVILVLNGLLAKPIKIDMPYQLIINENTARTNVILGEKFTTLQGVGYIHEEIGHIRYRISPRAFFQINSVQTKVLYDVVAAQINDGERVIDAYSGIGGIALYIANKVQKVAGIESVPEAVEDAVYNAILNGIKNARFLCGPAEDMLPDLLKQGAWDTLILDPPRKGADVRLLKAAVDAKIPKIIYVSCNPAALARDLSQLAKGCYQLTMVQPVDMFPMTGHVEAVCLLEKTC